MKKNLIATFLFFLTYLQSYSQGDFASREFAVEIKKTSNR